MEIDMALALTDRTDCTDHFTLAPRNPATRAQPPAGRCPEAERDRSAFNAAFRELGLRWQWDAPTYDALVAHPCERERLRRYLAQEQAHLLRAYDAEFLADAILDAKQRRRATASGSLPSAAWASTRDVAHGDEIGF
jgi:hypothetical protein